MTTHPHRSLVHPSGRYLLLFQPGILYTCSHIVYYVFCSLALLHLLDCISDNPSSDNLCSPMGLYLAVSSSGLIQHFLQSLSCTQFSILDLPPPSEGSWPMPHLGFAPQIVQRWWGCSFPSSWLDYCLSSQFLLCPIVC